MPTNDKEIFISVSAGSVVVCRYRRLPNGTGMMECASNADELENDAITAVIAHGNSFFTGHLHACPPDLAARACWN
jgi:hypothetical protein